MIEKPSSNAVEGNFDSLRVICQAGRVGLVVLEQESSEALTSWPGETVDCANRIGGFLRKLFLVNPSSDSDSKVFVVPGKFAVTWFAAGDGDEIVWAWFAEEATRRDVVARQVALFAAIDALSKIHAVNDTKGSGGTNWDARRD